MIHISHTLEASLVLVLFFFVALPALVTALLALTVILATGDRAERPRR